MSIRNKRQPSYNFYTRGLNSKPLADLGAIATIIAAIVAAANAAFISIYLTYEKRKSERASLQKDLAHTYMLQLQYMTESLWFRINNIVNGRSLELKTKINFRGQDNPDDNYYIISTLYELGSILAYNRIMLLEGIYSQLEDSNPTSGDWLKQKLEYIDGKLDQMGPVFYRYHRIALAEALIKRGPDNHLYILTFLEFAKDYLNPDSIIKPYLGPAIELVTKVKNEQWIEFMLELSTISSDLEKETGIKTPREISSYLQERPMSKTREETASHLQEENIIKVCIDKVLKNKGDPYQPWTMVEGKHWQARQTLRIRFIGGDIDTQNKVRKESFHWSNFCGIKFCFVSDGNADIRISFQKGGSWSYIGTDAQDVPQSEPTMNFGWLNKAIPDVELSQIKRHEFGHALGMIHEHQNPAGGIDWNKEAVYEYYKNSPNGWSKEEVDHNLFERYNRNISNFAKFDPNSIMLFQVPAEYRFSHRAIGSMSNELSFQDKELVKTFYPF